MPSIFKLTNHEVFTITANGAVPCGFLATWVLPASLMEGTPRLLILASPENYTTKEILKTSRFVIHLLSKDQVELVPRFGLDASDKMDKFSNLETEPSDYGPIIKGCAGHHFCELAASYDIGERYIFIGDVKGGDVDLDALPLRKNEAFAALPLEVREKLMEKHAILGKNAPLLFKKNLP